jgi:hypothetical protein
MNPTYYSFSSFPFFTQLKAELKKQKAENKKLEAKYKKRLSAHADEVNLSAQLDSTQFNSTQPPSAQLNSTQLN